MITSDIGFKVVNYVGTYHLVDDNGVIRIVSKEFHPSRKEEQALNSKILFSDNFKTNEYITVELANINIKKDQEILDFCNKYGLPYSSVKVQEVNPGYNIWGLPVSEQEYAQFDPYYRQDTMSHFEFCRHVSTAKRMMQVKHEIESSEKNPVTMLKYLFPLLLYDRIGLYDFNEGDPERHSKTMEFQYYYLNVINRRKMNDHNPMLDLFEFCSEIQGLAKGTNKVPLGDDDITLLKNPFVNKLYRFIIEVMKLNTKFLNSVTRDEFFNITLPDNVEISTELKNLMYDIAPTVLSDSINELLCLVHPKMEYSNASFHVDWDFNFLFEGFSMELLLMLSSSNMLKKCQNPTCEKFFTPNNGHMDKMYCSHRCGSLVAKRNQRIKDKLDPNRPRLEPGFKSRKKK